MKKAKICGLTVLALLLTSCMAAEQREKKAGMYSGLQPEAIKSVMTHVADWQLANPSKHHPAHWASGALYAGMTAWAQMADSDKYDQALMDSGNKANWSPWNRVFHADDYCAGQMFIDMYKKHNDPKMIKATRANFDHILANRPTSAMEMKDEGNQDRWNWCDALFMGPPVWAKLARVTGEEKYLDFMNKEWWATTDYLYDKEEHLYFRDSRYFDRREENGQKIFWSRGNGWVFAGVTRVIDELPADFPDKPKYIQLYKEMAAKLIQIQPEEGLWHSSLLDPVSFPSVEASGSGFYCYGLAWGINKGLLDEETYLPAVIKAWNALTDCVHEDGKLGYVQPIGADPRHVTADQTEIYGVGSFLLAGTEVYKIAVRKGQKVTKVIVTNPGLFFRDSETVSIDGFSDRAVFDLQSNKLLITQSLDGQLLFQTDLAPGQKKAFWVMPKPYDLEKPKSDIMTYCRFVPEREDDFTWENDLIAFRMYGPVLWDDAVNTGVDCWLKRVTYPIIDKWYGQMKEKTYHTDWGEGYDPYHVGKTTGCGGLRIVEDGKLIHSNVYDKWEVIANGPIRSIFELTCDQSWKASDKNMVEIKRVTIDLGQRLCRFESRFKGKDAAEVNQFAVGVTTHDGKAQSYDDASKGLAYCWEEIDGSGLGTAAIVVSPAVERAMPIASENADESHIYLITDKTAQPVITYYVGYGWEKAGQIITVESWQAYLENFKKCLDTPVSVKLKKIK